MYEQQTWADGPGGQTPLSAERLNHLEQGVAEVARRVRPANFTIQSFVGQAYDSLKWVPDYARWSDGTEGFDWGAAWTWNHTVRVFRDVDIPLPRMWVIDPGGVDDDYGGHVLPSRIVEAEGAKDDRISVYFSVLVERLDDNGQGGFFFLWDPPTEAPEDGWLTLGDIYRMQWQSWYPKWRPVGPPAWLEMNQPSEYGDMSWRAKCAAGEDPYLLRLTTSFQFNPVY